jgi:hypothetical protein
LYIDVNGSPLFLFEGNDGASINAAATVNNVAVSSKLESDEFVVIKLDSGSEAYRQFVQICILFDKFLHLD